MPGPTTVEKVVNRCCKRQKTVEVLLGRIGNEAQGLPESHGESGRSSERRTAQLPLSQSNEAAAEAKLKARITSRACLPRVPPS